MKFFINIQACVKLIMGISIAPINNRRGGKSEFKKKVINIGLKFLGNFGRGGC